VLESEQAYPMVLEPHPRPARPARAPRGALPAPPAAAEAALEEENWVIASQSGDRAAFEQIVRRTARLLFSRLYLETGDAHKAEDLVQETFMVAWRNIRQVTEPEGFRPWLLSIAHSVRVDAARREGRKKRGGVIPPKRSSSQLPEMDPLQVVPDPGPRPEESAELEERRRQVLAMLRSMPEEYREPISMRYLAGADYETIGRQLGLSNGSLRGLLNRGMAKLREKMKGLEL
jgi:RNA polymerase sigma-70 factor (ECF subfamily)